MLALVEIGHFCLILALLCASIQMALGFIPAPFIADLDKRQWARILQIMSAGLVCAAFGMLIHSFVTSDFSVALVAQHSHSAKPLLYKISGSWGNHEGSLLLWIVILVLFGGGFALTCGTLPARISVLTLSVQASVTSAFLAFSLFTSNPFARLENPPLDGKGLNPILQDIGLALHPPMLYVGYVGLSMAYALAVAGLIWGGGGDKGWERDWGAWMRPWVLVAWCALTLGIALGSWWAYYELGWGGWWFWDPVENVSLMPWLLATALIHSVIVVEKQGIFKNWTILLAILAFSLSLIGTFIVRSGLLTSVHAFASDPSRGVFILIIIMLAMGVPLGLFAWRGGAAAMQEGGDNKSTGQLLSRETGLMVNNVILAMATAIVMVGTLYPLGLELVSGQRVTVGPPYFAATFQPVMIVALLGMVVGPVLIWRGGMMKYGWRIIGMAAGGASMAAVAGMVFFNFSGHVGEGAISVTGLAGLAVLGWLAVGVGADMWARLKPHQITRLTQRLRILGLGVWGMWLGHLGMAMFLGGALGEGLGGREVIMRAKVGEVIQLGEMSYRFEIIETNLGANYESLTAQLVLENAAGTELTRLMPEKRFYPVAGQTTTEAAIKSGILGDEYAVLGDGDAEKGYSFRLYRKPFVSWIWGGAGVMALGGGLAFWSRRRRI